MPCARHAGGRTPRIGTALDHLLPQSGVLYPCVKFVVDDAAERALAGQIVELRAEIGRRCLLGGDDRLVRCATNSAAVIRRVGSRRPGPSLQVCSESLEGGDHDGGSRLLKHR